MLVRFMNTASETGCSDIFELKSLDTSLVALFLEALIDPSIGLEHYVIFITSQSHQNTYNQDQGFQIRTFQLQRLIRIPRFLHEPLRYVDEIKITYQELRGDYSRIQCHLESLNEQEPLPEDLHNRPNLNHKLQVTEAIFLTAVLALNSILRAMYPDDSVLLLEASTLVNELITLAKTAFQYRPLGASYIPPCLVAAVSQFLASTIFCILEVTDRFCSGRLRVLWKPSKMRLSRCLRNISTIMLA